MAQKVKLSGFRELDRALGELKGSLERGVLRRVATKALQPVLDEAKRLAPVDEGDLRDSIQIAGSGLSDRAKRAERGRRTRGVRVFLGTAARTAVPIEYGTYKMPAQPFLRPAWESNKKEALQIVKDELSDEIRRTAERAARRTRRKR